MVDEKVKPKETPKILTKPLPQILDEMEGIIESAAEAARRAAEANAKAEEALSKAEEALVAAKTKTLFSWQTIIIIVVVMLGSIFGAVAISLGLSALGQ
jgi:ElaB/YqjD/DUF883 family membrane-anchored ribosome-binding protein